MHQRVRKIRTEIAELRHGRRPTAVQYRRVIRSNVTALARRRQARGADLTTMARDVGVAPWTLALWLRKPSRPMVRAVGVVPRLSGGERGHRLGAAAHHATGRFGRRACSAGQGLAAEP